MFRSVFTKKSLIRLYSSNPTKVYSFDEFKSFVVNPTVRRILVDVREPSELKDYKLPNSVNIPYKTQPLALSLTSEQFKSDLGFDKPDTNKELVFFCAKGVRAKIAEDIANKNGYTNTATYPGSMTEWLEKGGRNIS